MTHGQPDRVLLRIGPEHPCDLLHGAQRWLTAIGVLRALGDRKRDPVAAVGQLAALDDLVAQAGSLDDGREAAGEAERGFAVAGGPPANLDAHVPS
jgi:hypothetical protein